MGSLRPTSAQTRPGMELQQQPLDLSVKNRFISYDLNRQESQPVNLKISNSPSSHRQQLYYEKETPFLYKTEPKLLLSVSSDDELYCEPSPYREDRLSISSSSSYSSSLSHHHQDDSDNSYSDDSLAYSNHHHHYHHKIHPIHQYTQHLRDITNASNKIHVKQSERLHNAEDYHEHRDPSPYNHHHPQYS